VRVPAIPFIETLVEYLTTGECRPRDELSRMFCHGEIPQLVDGEIPEGWIVLSALKNPEREDFRRWALDRTDSYIVRRMAGFDAGTSEGWESARTRELYECSVNPTRSNCARAVEEVVLMLSKCALGFTCTLSPLDIYLVVQWLRALGRTSFADSPGGSP